MSTAAPAKPKRARTARQQRAEHGVIDVRIIGWEPSPVDHADGGRPPQPPDVPPKRTGGGRSHEPPDWLRLLAMLGMLLFMLLVLSRPRREESDA